MAGKINDVGILLRGKSLEKLFLIHNKFDKCYIVNTFTTELGIIEEYVRNKSIAHFVGGTTNCALQSKKQYRKFNIKEVQFSFTKSMHARKFTLIRFYNSLGIEKIEYLPEEYRDITKAIRNTGMCCIFYVSEIIQSTTIWIAGLDFYRENYLIKDNSSHQLLKSKEINMVGSFVKIVKDHPDIEYNLVTYYKELPKLGNLNILV